ncbi:MAG: isoprenylcysteine carboxylmethyltransferase family protein [Bacteroidota bacterium]|nr:isoprenylcysteine carboxylmethyltransferase family protein [Bacteroidota bacterium]MDP4233387.1 isoprenylcysteine carboxylmethyltransferase family protein [Bacteroidota bacterium]MDP4242253.1 isoprenylcysteine carboxylmethyltransferase family protein [Bacteroidota bacterium]MDP4287009.1 isoprenylcysteine carboxylmethyltransferase family protein [Bacteroidota bacterium]
MTDLNRKALGGLLALILILAAVLFSAAGTFGYWQAWLFLTIFGSSVLAITLYLMKYDPKLLERRVNAGPAAEKQKSQKIIQGFAQIAFLLVIAFPAVDHRMGWSLVPAPIVIAGDGMVALGLLLVFFVFKANTFTSGTIEVMAEQTVISTGPYAVVRHPMYVGGLIFLIGVPLALGSWWGLIAVVPITLVIILRLLDEERFLAANLPVYSDYSRIVKYRLVPFIW